jgi:hypothetical protein
MHTHSIDKTNLKKEIEMSKKNKYPLPYAPGNPGLIGISPQEREQREIIRKQYNKEIPYWQDYFDLTMGAHRHQRHKYRMNGRRYETHKYLENIHDSIGGVTGKHDIKNYEFEGGKFSNNLFERSDIENVTFRRMRLKNTHFLNCILSECNFYQTSDSKGSFVDSYLIHVHFKDYTAYMTDFKGAKLLAGCRFERCDLTKARNLKLIDTSSMSDKNISNLLEQKLNRGDRLYFEKLLLSKI